MIICIGNFPYSAINIRWPCLPVKALLIAIASWSVIASDKALSDDNLIAQRLFNQQRYAEAAEIYTNPAWKGIALYRSSQWWRAAEAFIRADDATSIFNLGNTYVKLGFHELALQAYQQALLRQPDFDDASFNAELMRSLLSLDDNPGGESALQRRGEEIDRVDSDGDEQPGGSSNEDSEENRNDQDTGNDREGDTDERGPSPDAIASGDSSEAGSNDTVEDDGSPQGGATKGTEAETQTQSNPSTGAEGSDDSSDAEAASRRARLETAQATEQWLNQINHDSLKYLQKRIDLELSRRRAAGEAAPEGGSPW